MATSHIHNISNYVQVITHNGNILLTYISRQKEKPKRNIEVCKVTFINFETVVKINVISMYTNAKCIFISYLNTYLRVI